MEVMYPRVRVYKRREEEREKKKNHSLPGLTSAAEVTKKASGGQPRKSRTCIGFVFFPSGMFIYLFSFKREVILGV